MRRALLCSLLLLGGSRSEHVASTDEEATAAAAALLAQEASPPLLAYERVGYSVDHRVGSPPASHFGLLLRNDGGGELQIALFVSSSMARFYLPRPASLRLRASEAHIVDIRCPLYLLEKESRFRDNATLSLQSNGGSVTLALTPETFPEPHRMRVHQRGNGAYSWVREPEYSTARFQLAWAVCFGLLTGLWVLARAARMHVRAHGVGGHGHSHGGGGAHACCDHARGDGAEEEGEEGEEAALAAVRRYEAEETAQRRAADKNAALAAWDAEERAAEEVEEGGAGPAAPLPGAALCAVCLLRPRDTAILPCRHVAVCGPCVRRLSAPGTEPSARVCPICRGKLESWLELYMS